MSSNLLSLAGWYFLPNIVTSNLQSLLYTLTTRAGDPKPSPRSPRYARDRTRIHVAVILAYLAYTVYEADYQLRQAGDFYTTLGVGHDVDEGGLGRRFRRLTLQYHPDKASDTASKQETEALYIALKLARDTLANPTKRLAYDRLGPAILSWPALTTPRDYIFRGLQQTAAYYAASALGLVLVGLLGYARQGRFWRFVVMGALFVGEVWVITRPGVVGWGNKVVVGMGVRGALLPWQVLVLARKLAFTFFVALAQLGPLFEGSGGDGPGGDVVEPVLVERLEVLARTADAEVGRLMGLEITPFAGDGGSMRGLRESVREWLVQNTVRNDAEVKGAVGRVLERRRAEGTLPVLQPDGLG